MAWPLPRVTPRITAIGNPNIWRLPSASAGSRNLKLFTTGFGLTRLITLSALIDLAVRTFHGTRVLFAQRAVIGTRRTTADIASREFRPRAGRLHQRPLLLRLFTVIDMGVESVEGALMVFAERAIQVRLPSQGRSSHQCFRHITVCVAGDQNSDRSHGDAEAAAKPRGDWPRACSV